MSADLPELLQRALRLAEEGDWEALVSLVNEALQESPEEPALFCWLGVAEHELGQTGAAYDHFRAALALNPEEPELLATIGNGLARFDDPDAEAALRSAAVMAPEQPRARLLYGAYLAREGFLSEAKRELEAAEALAPEDADVAYEMGVAFALAGELDAALDHLARSVDLDPGGGWAQVVMGLIEVELGRFEEGAGDLSSGARARPEDVEAQLLAALAAEGVGMEDLAQEMLERGRQVAAPGDLPLLETVEARLDEGVEASRELLVQDLLPGALRERLMVRP